MALGDPVGNDLVVGTTNGNTLPEAPSWEEREITFSSGIQLISGVKYAIVVRAVTNELEWIDITPSGYANGNNYTSTDAGVSWTGYSNYDNWFTTKANGVVKDSYNPVSEATYDSIYGNDWAAQTFIASSTYTITSVVLKLARWTGTSPGTVTVSIRATVSSKEYKVNIGPFQGDAPGSDYKVNIGPDQSDALVAPQIVDQSGDQIVSSGQETELFVTATGEPSPSYQWYKNDVEMSGKTNSTLTIYPTTTATYKCKVYNVVGEVWSDPIIITVVSNPYRYNLLGLQSDLDPPRAFVES